jgi:E3 ubiquitin-protein ligase TRIP12
MVKARVKAERAAARQASAIASNAATPAPVPTPNVSAPHLVASQDAAQPEAESTEPQTQDSEETLPAPAPKEGAVDRAELLRSKSGVVGRFMQLILPILVDVYAASVIIPVRVKSLTALLKAIGFLDGDGIKRVLNVGCCHSPCCGFSHITLLARPTG